MTERVDLQEFVGGFVAEAEELVVAAGAALLEIDRANAEGSSKPRAVRDLFRALHTLKGLAGMIGVEPIVAIAHALETLVRAADKSGGTLRHGAVEVSVQAVQAIDERVRAVAEQREVAPAPEALLEALAATDAASAAPMVPPPLTGEWEARLSASERQQVFVAMRDREPVWTLTFVPNDARAAAGVTIGTVRARLGAVGEIVKVAPRALAAGGVAFDILLVSAASEDQLREAGAADTLARLQTPADVAQPADPEPEDEMPTPRGGETATLGRSLVRVELSRLDDLQEQLSLLIVSRFRLDREIAALAGTGADVRRLREISDQQVRMLRDLRRAILRARLVRVGEVLEPLQLLARSLNRPGHKEVRLELDARDAELDKAVADHLLPAIIHLVRNAVDHAIEPVDERLAAGKPRAGTVRVSCVEVGGSRLELAVSDDGRGIDREDVARRAGRELAGDDDLIDVLTTPGFSTRDIASTTSGRGLGMDIVRRIAVTQLGGELAFTTARGQGTTFTLRVPLTLSIIDVFSFTCAGQAFVVPVSAVEEIIELDQARSAAGGAREMTLVARRGRPMPVFSLGALLALDDGAGAHKGLVVRRGGDTIAFAVDRLVGRQEVVVRQIDDPLGRAPGISGATDLGDGRPTLMLDLGELSLTARGGST